MSYLDEVHLQTLIVGISGKDLKGYVRALFNTGSQNTYISKYAAKMIKLENLRTEKIKHGLFGGVEMSENLNHYRFTLRGDLLHKQAFQRQSASPVAGFERPSQDTASASSYVTRTGRVIKPPQRLGM
ncbi:hypothetical protein NPIL_38951 [Nephila pilipes]|uniref:Peptidase aspartic putative domain-containing protein n=1 Tax=Nephila pilipes TaxID=299642 RepID=A0A8X6TR89_NEPPI|nr:hypothetical protein NPIL_38951 [Nephila pilipes]